MCVASVWLCRVPGPGFVVCDGLCCFNVVVVVLYGVITLGRACGDMIVCVCLQGCSVSMCVGNCVYACVRVLFDFTNIGVMYHEF